MAKYDDASWHYNGEFPADQPKEHGGTHRALFLKWCFLQGWAGQLHLDDAPEAVQGVIDGSLAATRFLFTHCDGKLTDEDLSDQGNAFAAAYYGDYGLYLDDYANHFDAQMYIASEAEHDFAAFAAILQQRFDSGELLRPGQPDEADPICHG